MSVVAIAGGTGNLGRAFIDALVVEGSTKVIVLARKSSPEKEQEIGASIIAIDFSDPESIAKVLEIHQVDTLISTVDSNVGNEPEFALIRAAELSSVTKRYIPCLWGIDNTKPGLSTYFPIAAAKAKVVERVARTKLEWTAVQNGLFIDLFTAPKVPSYFHSMAMVVDIQANIATIPGTGNEPIVFTHSYDLAKFVVALVTSKEKWEKDSVVIGDKISWNEFVTIAEKAKGTKFDVSYESPEILRAGSITELPSHSYIYPFFPKEALQGMLSSFYTVFAKGDFNLDTSPSTSLNHRFPDIRPRSVQELISQAWGVSS